MTVLDHVVTVRAGAQAVDRWTKYTIDLDILQPADAFALSFGPATRALYEVLAPDVAVEVLVDDITVLTGFVDDRVWSDARDGSTIEITGRDKGGRLVDESMPLTSFRGLGIVQLAEAAARPWFPKVSLSNAENRRLLRGSGAPIARVSKEPPIATGPHPEKKVVPGQTRWQVLSGFLQEAGLLGWSTADGAQLVVGKPNYDQEPQYHFVQPGPRSARAREGNVASVAIRHSVGERYSMVVAMGAGRGDTANYGAAVTKHRAVAKDGPGAQGEGGSFRHPKVLYVADDEVRNIDQAVARAAREKRQRDASGHELDLVVPGHAQLVEGRPVLYAPDTMASVEHEETGLSGLYLVTSVAFAQDRQSGPTTRLRLVPRGTELA